MKKIIMLFVLVIVCVGVQAQSKNIKTMLFSKLGYDVQEKTQSITLRSCSIIIPCRSLVETPWSRICKRYSIQT